MYRASLKPLDKNSSMIPLKEGLFISKDNALSEGKPTVNSKQSPSSLVLPSYAENTARTGAPQEDTQGSYASLKHLLKQQGLLDKQPKYYIHRIALLSVLLVLCILLLVAV